MTESARTRPPSRIIDKTAWKLELVCEGCYQPVAIGDAWQTGRSRLFIPPDRGSYYATFCGDSCYRQCREREANPTEGEIRNIRVLLRGGSQ